VCPRGSKPRRFTCSCPSPNRAATWCAQCSASAVLPTPAVPPIALIPHRPRRISTSTVKHLRQRHQLGRPAGETGHRRRQLPRHHHPASRAGRGASDGQQLLNPVRRNRQHLGQLGPQPRLRLSLAAFPAHHRGALYAQPLGQLFLSQAHRLTTLCQKPRFTAPLVAALSSNVRISPPENGRLPPVLAQHTLGGRRAGRQ
jgi:hypothetical protein